VPVLLGDINVFKYCNAFEKIFANLLGDQIVGLVHAIHRRRNKDAVHKFKEMLLKLVENVLDSFVRGT
jgi:hypothetical protein